MFNLTQKKTSICKHPGIVMRFVVLLAFIVPLLFSENIFADDIDESDLASLKSYNYLLRSKHTPDARKNLLAKKDLSYVESYLLALILQGDKDQKSAALRYANAAFKYKPIPENIKPETLVPYMESGTRRSPLYSECVLEISRIYLHLYGAETASKMLSLLPANPDKVLKRKVTEFRVEIISKLNYAMAIEVYKGILRDYQSPLLYLRLGGLNYHSGNHDISMENYLRVFDFPENEWTYSKAVEAIEYFLKKVPAMQAKLDNFRLVQMAEGYRINKKFPKSQTLWKSIDLSKLDNNGLHLYLQNYCRLDLNLGQFDHCLKIARENIARLDSASKDRFYKDIGNRLFYMGKFFLVVELVPETEFRFPSLVRLRALDKIKSASPGQDLIRAQIHKEARNYLTRFDSDSQIAEGVFFNHCFGFIDNAQNDEALQCLGELGDLTKGASVGGRARYFMARIYEKKGDLEKSQEMYRQVYLNSPEHFYAFPALRKIIPKTAADELIPRNPAGEGADKSGMSPEYLKRMQEWIAVNFSRPEYMERYFLEKKKRPGFGVDRFWVNFEEKFYKTVKSMNSVEQKASLFGAMGFDYLANDYLNSIDDTERKFLIMLNSGIVSDDAYLKATYMHALLDIYKKQTDIMTISPLVADCIFPTPYKEIVTAASQKYNIEAASVYALMKQESGFHPGATSSSGAKGLMQIMPATATWLNKTLKIRNLNLYDPNQSIELGGYFYSWLFKVSDGAFENMAIAYNAGPTMLAIWRNKFYRNDQELFLEKIPVDETYFYVQKTRNYYDRYRILINLAASK